MVGPVVAFDTTAMLGRQTGIGRSVGEVSAALDDLPDGPRLLRYALGRPAHRPSLPPGARLVPIPTRLLLAAWSRTEQPRVDRWVRGATVLHATAFVAPPSRLPTLVTVHDCAFALHPETVAGTVHSFGPLLRRAVARGAHVHTGTRHVAAEVQELLGVDLESQGRLHVVPLGIPRLTAPPSPDAAPEVPGRPYVLALGTQDPRKNLPALVRAFAQLDEDLGLMLAGSPGLGSPAVEAALRALPTEVRGRIEVLGTVDESTRVRLVSGAAALAYPSLYEGFGFPVLEAMALGVPALAADLPVLREVAGQGAVFVDPHDDAAIAEGLRIVVRGGTVEEGLKVAASYTWERTAEGLAAAYRTVSSSA